MQATANLKPAFRSPNLHHKQKKAPEGTIFLFVREAGLEPARPYGH